MINDSRSAALTAQPHSDVSDTSGYRGEIAKSFLSNENESPIIQHTRAGCYEVCKKRHNGGFWEKVCKNACNLGHPTDEDKCEMICGLTHAHYGNVDTYRKCYEGCLSKRKGMYVEGKEAHDLVQGEDVYIEEFLAYF